jgi:hypothetical protein
MNRLRSLLVLASAFTLATAAFAADGDQRKPSDGKAAKAPCGCAIKDNAKVCGVDKDCCCTGEKATKAPAKATTSAGK